MYDATASATAVFASSQQIARIRYHSLTIHAVVSGVEDGHGGICPFLVAV